MYNYTPKPYTPLVHWNIRFYFSAPYRYSFSSDADSKRFEAVKAVLSELTPGEYGIVKAIIAKPSGIRDLQDSYIHERIKERGMNEKNISRFYKLLDYIDREIALKLGYIDHLN